MAPTTTTTSGTSVSTSFVRRERIWNMALTVLGAYLAFLNS
jgi:hypothetical protein